MPCTANSIDWAQFLIASGVDDAGRLVAFNSWK